MKHPNQLQNLLRKGCYELFMRPSFAHSTWFKEKSLAVLGINVLFLNYIVLYDFGGGTIA